MNWLETIYCSQYYELKTTNRDPMKGRNNGTVLAAAILMLVIISAIVLYCRLSPGNPIDHLFRGSHLSGRSIGKIIGLVGLGAIYGILYLTFGSPASYDKLVKKWETLPAETLARTKKTSLIIFGVAFVAFLIVIFTGL